MYVYFMHVFACMRGWAHIQKLWKNMQQKAKVPSAQNSVLKSIIIFFLINLHVINPLKPNQVNPLIFVCKSRVWKFLSCEAIKCWQIMFIFMLQSARINLIYGGPQSKGNVAIFDHVEGVISFHVTCSPLWKC